MNEFLGYIWGNSGYALSLGALLFFIFLFVVLTQNFLNALDALGLKTRGSSLFKNFSRKKRWLQGALLILSLLIMWVGLMRPQLDKDEEESKLFGRELVVALDISRSMLAKDMNGDKEDRFTVAKRKIKALVERLETDRVALILYAGSAFVYCPLTSDLEIFLSMLDDIDTQMISAGSTSIESAIKAALDMFKNVSQNKTKILTIFTDGEDFSPDLAKLRKEIEDKHLTIFTVGLGSASGAPIPLYSYKNELRGTLRDERGAVVISKLDEKTLRAVAQASGGKYINATSDLRDILQLKKELNRFERQELEGGGMKAMKEFYYYFSAVAGLLVLVEWLL